MISISGQLPLGGYHSPRWGNQYGYRRPAIGVSVSVHNIGKLLGATAIGGVIGSALPGIPGGAIIGALMGALVGLVIS